MNILLIAQVKKKYPDITEPHFYRWHQEKLVAQHFIEGKKAIDVDELDAKLLSGEIRKPKPHSEASRIRRQKRRDARKIKEAGITVQELVEKYPDICRTMWHSWFKRGKISAIKERGMIVYKDGKPRHGDILIYNAKEIETKFAKGELKYNPHEKKADATITEPRPVQVNIETARTADLKKHIAKLMSDLQDKDNELEKIKDATTIMMGLLGEIGGKLLAVLPHPAAIWSTNPSYYLEDICKAVIKQAIEDTESIGSEETEKLKAEHNANDSLAQQNREYIEGIKNHPTNADMESLVKHNEELRDYLIVKKNELVVKEGIIREKDQKITKMGNTIAEKEAELRELKAAIVNKFLEDNSGL